MNKSWKTVLIVFLVLLVIIVLLLLSMPALCICIGKLQYQADLNNPIINAKYEGWKSIALDDSVQIKIPYGWKLETGDNPILYDEAGHPVAYGVKTTPITDPLRNFLSEYYGTNMISFEKLDSYQEEHAPRVFWNGCDSYIRISNYEDGTSSQEIVVKLIYRYEYQYTFCFFYPPEDESYYFEIAEAIAWSATW